MKVARDGFIGCGIGGYFALAHRARAGRGVGLLGGHVQRQVVGQRVAREHAAVVDEADAVPAVDLRRVQAAGRRIHEDVDDEERPVRAKRGGREDVGDVQESEARRAAHIEVEEKEVHDGRVAPRGVALAVAEQEIYPRRDDGPGPAPAQIEEAFRVHDERVARRRSAPVAGRAPGRRDGQRAGDAAAGDHEADERREAAADQHGHARRVPRELGVAPQAPGHARRALRRVGQQPDRVERAQAAEVRGGAVRKGVVPEGSEQVAACHEGLRPDRPRRGAALSQARGEHKQGRHERVVRHPSRRLRVDAVAHGSARRRAAVAPTPLDDASRGSSGGATAAQRARARISSIWLSGSAQIAPEQAKGQPSWYPGPLPSKI
ncbi:unnamed protein product [Pelagomonas calceolata]|uniref:Uncharacterized protein n=1 Tax=Pelagomonas calceolata TaxID=35677 RepID=A0A8J2X4Z8_9STRA|nr:unnamed protein product [Pelagomonas calceolata]